MFLAAGILDQARETAEQFGWEPKLFLSQVISFIIVALVLKQFAYKPILAVLEERRQRIAEGLLNADKIKQQLADAEQRHAEILAKANTQAPPASSGTSNPNATIRVADAAGDTSAASVTWAPSVSACRRGASGSCGCRP